MIRKKPYKKFNKVLDNAQKDLQNAGLKLAKTCGYKRVRRRK